MHYSKGFARALLASVLFVASCGSVEVKDRRYRVKTNSQDQIASGETRKPIPSTTPKKEKPVEETPDSTLLWDGVEVVAPNNILILEME